MVFRLRAKAELQALSIGATAGIFEAGAAFGRNGVILHAVKFDFSAKSQLFRATSNTFSNPTKGFNLTALHYRSPSSPSGPGH